MTTTTTTTTTTSSSSRPGRRAAAMAQQARMPSSTMLLFLLLVLLVPSITVAFLFPVPAPQRSSSVLRHAGRTVSAVAPRLVAAAAAAASDDDDEDDEEDLEDCGPRPPRASTPAPIPISYENPALPTKTIDGVWNGQRKPLLRLGTKGVQKSHRNSLKELLVAHKAVRVKVNGPALPPAVKSIADSLAAAPPGEEYPLAVVLRVKGKEFLLVTPEELAGMKRGQGAAAAE